MLSGFRIIEIEALGPGPFAAMHLADLGADVIVIHKKNGNNGITGNQSIIDRGKRSIELDLKDPNDLEIAKDLICFRRRTNRRIPTWSNGAIGPRTRGLPVVKSKTGLR